MKKSTNKMCLKIGMTMLPFLVASIILAKNSPTDSLLFSISYIVFAVSGVSVFFCLVLFGIMPISYTSDCKRYGFSFKPWPFSKTYKKEDDWKHLLLFIEDDEEKKDDTKTGNNKCLTK